MKKKTKSNIYDWLLILTIILLGGGAIGGAFRPVRILAIALFPLLVIKGPSCKYIKNIAITCGLFWVYCACSLAWTPDIEEGLIQMFYYLTHFAILLEVIVFAYFAKQPLISISAGWLLVMLFCTSIAVWEMLTGNHLPMAYEDNNFIHDETGALVNRMVASVTFANFNNYGAFLCFALPWLYNRLVSANYRYLDKTITVFIIAIAMLTVLINGSRGGIISMICMLIIFLYSYKNKTVKLLIVVPIIIAVTYLLVIYHEEIFMVISMRESISSEFGKSEGLYGGRIGIWLTALRALLPTAGLGVGVGGMEKALEAYRTNSDIINMTHNMFVELLLQYGVIWFIILIMFICRLIKKTNKIIDYQRSIPLKMALWVMPVYCIINSSYLMDPALYVLFGCIYVFTYYDIFTRRASLTDYKRDNEENNN